MNMTEKEKINELVLTIDKLMAEGTGHVNVSNLGMDEEMEIYDASFECNIKGACCQPTEILE